VETWRFCNVVFITVYIETLCPCSANVNFSDAVGKAYYQITFIDLRLNVRTIVLITSFVCNGDST
jgi:hypothetical protein